MLCQTVPLSLSYLNLSLYPQDQIRLPLCFLQFYGVFDRFKHHPKEHLPSDVMELSVAILILSPSCAQMLKQSLSTQWCHVVQVFQQPQMIMGKLLSLYLETGDFPLILPLSLLVVCLYWTLPILSRLQRRISGWGKGPSVSCSVFPCRCRT